MSRARDRVARLKLETAAAEERQKAEELAFEVRAERRKERIRVKAVDDAEQRGYSLGYDKGFLAGRMKYHTQRNEDLRLLPLHPSYLGWWVAIIIIILGLEVVETRIVIPGWPWVMVMVVFGGVELAAVLRNRPGDMFSELMWTFLWGGRARTWLVGSVAVYLSLRLSMILSASFPGWLPIVVLSLGIGAWLWTASLVARSSLASQLQGINRR